MRLELNEKPQPPPPPTKELVIRLSEEEARLLRTVLQYFQTTALQDGAGFAGEVKARRKLRKLFSDDLNGRLQQLGIEMVYGLNVEETEG